MVDLIPADVSARLLPKTLFGERYVDLVAPRAGAPAKAHRRGRHDRPGPDGGRDRAGAGVRGPPAAAAHRAAGEARRHPQRAGHRPSRAAAPGWARTSSWSTGTSRRSTPRCRRSRPTSAAWPTSRARMPWRHPTWCGRRRRSSPPTRRSWPSSKDALAGFLAGTAGFANTTADFLDANGQRIIQVGAGAAARPLEVFAKYAPQYPCMATGDGQLAPAASTRPGGTASSTSRSSWSPAAPRLPAG